MSGSTVFVLQVYHNKNIDKMYGHKTRTTGFCADTNKKKSNYLLHTKLKIQCTTFMYVFLIRQIDSIML